MYCSQLDNSMLLVLWAGVLGGRDRLEGKGGLHHGRGEPLDQGRGLEVALLAVLLLHSIL